MAQFIVSVAACTEDSAEKQQNPDFLHQIGNQNMGLYFLSWIFLKLQEAKPQVTIAMRTYILLQEIKAMLFPSCAYALCAQRPHAALMSQLINTDLCTVL